MALNIKSDEAHELARILAEATGVTMTDAVTEALRRSVAHATRTSGDELLLAEVAAIQAFVSDLPTRDSRTPEEILAYDDDGLPG